MSQSAAPFRPIGIGDLLDQSIALYRLGFRRLVAIGLIGFGGIAAVFLVAAIVLVAGIVLVAASGVDDVNQLFTDADSIPPAVVLPIVILVILAVPIASAVWITTTIALTLAVADLRLAHRTTIRETFRRAWTRVARYFWLGVLSTAAIMGMMITIVGIPFAIYFGVVWGQSGIVICLEEVGPRGALGRSRALMRGRWWRTVFVAFVFSLFVGAVSVALSIPGAILNSVALPTVVAAGGAVGSPLYLIVAALSTVANIAQQVLTIPLALCPWVLYYYDLRVRQEGFDLSTALSALPDTGSSIPEAIR
jgi:hypothetical protein